MDERKSMMSHLFYDMNIINFSGDKPSYFFNVPVGVAEGPALAAVVEADAMRLHKERAKRTYHDTNIEVASQTVHYFIITSIDVLHLQTGALLPIVNACLFEFYIGSTRFLQVPLWRFARGPYVLNDESRFLVAPGQNFGATITPRPDVEVSLTGLVGVFIDGVHLVPTI